MDEHTLRVVKIDKEAIFELIYETFIAQEQELLDLSPVDVINDCAMDWERESLSLQHIFRKIVWEN